MLLSVGDSTRTLMSILSMTMHVHHFDIFYLSANAFAFRNEAAYIPYTISVSYINNHSISL
jgi:hypothetical protein